MQSDFYLNLSKNLSLFEGCGNMLGIVPLTLAGYNGDHEFWKTDPELRKLLTKWGKNIHSDSVMVLLGDPKKAASQGYHVDMAVFEPNGDDDSHLGGCISTMCGNGVRAVAAWVREFEPSLNQVEIMTMSGLRNIVVENNLYIVNMGEFTQKENDFSNYVRTGIVEANSNGFYIDTPIPGLILREISNFVSTKTWSMGLNGDRDKQGKIEGEPHIVFEIDKSEIESIEELRKIAVKVGPLITKNLKHFPKEINVNFISVRDFKDGKAIVWNCTHERNLGSDADHSVTAACGTGSTVAGGVVLEKLGGKEVLVKCTGGDLEIMKDESNSKNLLMKGPAARVKNYEGIAVDFGQKLDHNQKLNLSGGAQND